MSRQVYDYIVDDLTGAPIDPTTSPRIHFEDGAYTDPTASPPVTVPFESLDFASFQNMKNYFIAQQAAIQGGQPAFKPKPKV